MNFNPLFWLLLNLVSILVLSFYSMMEMACVSFNKVRLQYYVSNGNSHALRLNYLLQHPSYLFGTTLIGVNVALVFGSEFARQFHASLGLSPDLAPISQVFLVVIFGELAPMFAARRYAEHMAMLGINVLYFSARLMSPILWCLNFITRFTHWLMRNRFETSPNIFLNQDELKKIIEEHDEEKGGTGANEDFNAIVSNIFDLRGKTAGQIMTPIAKTSVVRSTCTIGEMRKILSKTPTSFLLIYHSKPTNVVGIAFPRDLLRESDNRRVRDQARPPWFISQQTEIFQILSQFRRNSQSVAVVLDEKGSAGGVVILEDLVEEIFGKTTLTAPGPHKKNFPLIERTIPGDLSIKSFNKLYDVNLDPQGTQTFAELILKILGHSPEVGESIYIPPFELKIKEVSFLEIKSLTIKTKISQ